MLDIKLDDLEVEALEEVIRIRVQKLYAVDDQHQIIDQRIVMWNKILVKLKKEP